MSRHPITSPGLWSGCQWLNGVLPNSRAYGYWLEKRARAAGVDIRTRRRVARILTDDGHVVGVECTTDAGTLERYRVQEWLNFITSEVHKGYSPLWNPNADPKVKEYALGNLEKKLDWINGQFGSKKYLTGDTFTVADAYLFTVINWSFFLGMNLDKWPALKEFHARVAARPKVQEAIEAEGLNKKAA